MAGCLSTLGGMGRLANRLWGKAPEAPRFSGGVIVDTLAIDPSLFGISSWEGSLAIVERVPRSSAIQVPAVKRSRDLIAGTLGSLPIDLYAPDKTLVRSALLEQPERNVPRSVTMTRLIEDMLFEQIGWWRITETDWTNFPTKVVRVAPGKVQVRNGKVYIDGVEVPSKELIRFDSPNDGLLSAAARAIRTALALESAVARYADGAPPLDYFTPTDGVDPEDAEVKDFLADWKTARQTRSTAYIPAAMQYANAGWSPEQLQMAEARQAARLEIALTAGVDPEEVGVSTTSRTYNNQFDRRKQFTDFTLGAYKTAIEDRLNMGDVTPRGYYSRFRLSDFLRSDDKTRYETYEVGLRVKAIAPDEIRAAEDKPPLTPEQELTMPQSPAPTASAEVATRFDSAPEIRLDVPGAQTFEIDLEKRTIKGLAVPYGVPGLSFGQQWQFTKGTLKYSDVSRVKLWIQHDPLQAVGVATELDDREDGLYASFKVARGDAGDRALILAEDGVLDGLSVGLRPGGKFQRDRAGVNHAIEAPMLEISLTAAPSFDDARIHQVAASAVDTKGNIMQCTKCGKVHPDGVTECAAPTNDGLDFSAITDAINAGFAALRSEAPQREEVSAAEVIVTSEPLPYRFDRGGNFAVDQEHVFSADLREMASARDEYGRHTEAGKRVMGLLQQTFATVTTDVNELTPAIQRPDMYVDQKDYKTPAWDIVNKGAPPNGVQPFTFPKFNSAASLVGDHTEGTEPTAGSFTTTGQTVTPTGLSGKASITREVWDMGGNPAVSGLIFNQMKRGYLEGLEQATADFLNTLTAATDITLTTAAVDSALAGEWDAALAELQFVRGYDFSAMVVEKVLYKTLIDARDSSGRVLYPILAPQNANGTAQTRFRTLDLGGVTGIPSWALASTAGAANNSWLFDPSVVHGWATPPLRLEFPGTNATGGYAPVAMIDLAIWGYKAFANSDIAGVRQVIYDSVV